MSDYHSKLADKDFINWIKTRIATDIFRTCVEPFVDTEITSFQRETLEAIANENKIKGNVYCSGCTTSNVLCCKTNNFCFFKNRECVYHCSPEKSFRTCSLNICNRFQELILQSHCYHRPSWKNTNAERWCQNAWELAKCYMPPDGYLDKTSIVETDLNGILSVMLNHSRFSGKIDKAICDDVRNTWNSFRHSATFLVSDQQLVLFLETLTDFLKISTAFDNDGKAEQALKNIEKLDSEELSITPADVTKVIVKSIEDEQIQSIKKITDESESCSKKLAKESENYLEELKKLKHEIESEKRKAINCINSAVSSQVSAAKDEIEKATEDAVAKIKSSMGEESKKASEIHINELQKQLREDLLDWNESKHNTIPLFDDDDRPVTEFYARPKLVSVERQKNGSFGSEKKIPINSLQDVFYTQQKRNNEIYLTSEAGFGKSCFSKFVVTTWWYSLKHITNPSSQYLSIEDKTVMGEFDYVFLLHLRELSNECDIDKMIFEHIIPYLSHSSDFTMSFLQSVLHDKNSLIILDGLDEWSHPSTSNCRRLFELIPHRKARAACTILTTSRPWKLGEINLKASQIDKHIQLNALGQDSILFIKKLLVTHLIEKNQISQVITTLNEEIKERGLENLESNPMLLIYLICLKTEGKKLGKSKSELYTQILDLILSRALDKEKHNMKIESTSAPAREIILPCFVGHNLSRQYYPLLKVLGHLAFNTLFDESRSDTLVFDKSKVNGFLSDEYTRVSLLSGILTESKERLSLLKKKFKVSFCHKTVQEYLAAFYMNETENKDEVVNLTLKYCNSTSHLLEMANVFVFLCGFNHKAFEKISKELALVVNRDKITTEYRHSCISSTSNYNMNIKPLKDFQSIHISCLKEIEENAIESIGEVKLYLYDLFIDEDCKNEKYMGRLKKIKDINEGEIKSVSIRTEWFTNLGNIWDTLQLQKESSLEKINFRGDCCNHDIQNLLSSSTDSLKSIEILSSMWINDRFSPKYTPWTDTMTNTFQRMCHLQALHLYAFEMSHTQLNEMLAYIEHHTLIKDIAVLNLKCIDHNDLCSGCQLELSGHHQLRLLSVDNIPLSEISVNVSQLKECVIGKISHSSVFLALLNSLKSALRIQCFTCRHIDSIDKIEAMIDVMCELPNLSYIRLLYCDLGETQFLLSKRILNIQLVRLVEVTMKCCVLCNIVSVIKELSQPVLVELLKCNVKTLEEFDKLKRGIKADSQILVLQEDGEFDLSFKSIGNDE